ncbi:high affinity copper uptake protein 1-like [Anticarsia gemmatalis]|uniref:high affinity copper uptake protein 1-like n=1 Tax=Anticarsia gemmatalis TaxID=129554 RepID=UPI003F76F628
MEDMNHMGMEDSNHDSMNHGNHMNMYHHEVHSYHAMLEDNSTNGMNDSFNSSDTLDMVLTTPRTDHSAHHHMGHRLTHSSDHNMAMTFHGGIMETILFSWWQVTDVGEFIGSFFAIFIMALLYEGLKYYRKHLLWKTYTGLQYCAVAPPDKGVANLCAPDEPQVIQPVPHALERNIPTMMSTAHAWQTVLHGVQVLVSYMLMLVFMTYNVWLCTAVVLGSATGYFLFGWRESVVVDFTEHCH